MTGDGLHELYVGAARRPPQLLPRAGALHANQSTLAVDVSPAERTQLAEPEARPEGDVEEADEKEVRLATQRIQPRQLDERLPRTVARLGARPAPPSAVPRELFDDGVLRQILHHPLDRRVFVALPDDEPMRLSVSRLVLSQ